MKVLLLNKVHECQITLGTTTLPYNTVLVAPPLSFLDPRVSHWTTILRNTDTHMRILGPIIVAESTAWNAHVHRSLARAMTPQTGKLIRPPS